MNSEKKESTNDVISEKKLLLIVSLMLAGVIVYRLFEKHEVNKPVDGPKVSRRVDSSPTPLPSATPVSALLSAVMSGDMQSVSEHVSARIVNEEDLNEALHAAVKSGSTDIAVLLLNGGADPDHLNGDFYSPLHIAVENKDKAMVVALLDHGARINDWDVLNWFFESALHAAVGSNQVELAEILIDRGADVNQTSSHHSSPLSIASYKGYMDMVRLLVNKGAQVYFGEDEWDDLALYKSVQKGHLEIARFLLEHGANVNQREGLTGKTPLHAAVEEENTEMVKLLLTYHPDTEIESEWSAFSEVPVPLGLAVDSQHTEIVHLLVLHGADVNKNGKNGCNGLQTAASKGDMAMVRFMLEHGADINWHGPDCTQTALDLAESNHYSEIARFLKTHGAKPKTAQDPYP